MIASADGTPLLLRRSAREGARGPVVLLGHGPSVHSGLLAGPIQTLAQAGATVWAGDLRGHGGSVSTRAPLAHLDPQTGWAALLDDMTAFAREAFKGVPPERRILVGGGISGHLMLEVLHRTPDLAGHLVMAAPLPHQPALTRISAAFLRIRSLVLPIDQPDPLIVHHLHGFLRAQLPPSGDNFDTITADPALQRAIRDDPRGFPTPTLGYWRAVFPGMFGTYDRIAPGSLPGALRVLVLSGPEDPQTRGGRLLPGLMDWFRSRGVQDATSRLIPGVRANVLIDAPRLPVVEVILSWYRNAARAPSAESALPDSPPTVATLSPVDSVEAYWPALESLGLRGLDAGSLASLPALIDLCYVALDDDSRWIELIYRLALGAEVEGVSAEDLLESIYPHWQRAFELREELRRAAMLGRLYNDLIDRLDLGVAVLDAAGTVRHTNAAFGRAVARLAPGHVGSSADWLRRLLAVQPAGRNPQADQPLIVDGHLAGISFVPASLQPQALGAEPSGRLVVLRDAGGGADSLAHRAGLLSLAYGLTGQEGAAALLLAEGLGTEAIAARMGVSENTLRSHLKQVFHKMDVSSRTEVAHRILAGPLGWLARSADPGAIEDRAG